MRNGDRLENIIHRHELSEYVNLLFATSYMLFRPPVTSIPVKVLHVDIEKDLIVIDKPGSIVRSPSSRIHDANPFSPSMPLDDI